jgi:osmotically-inducible protein OsmY
VGTDDSRNGWSPADDGLSFDAKNVKVITAEGVVTLRGAVGSEAERARIESIARAVSDVQRVDYQLEVATANVR